MGLTCIRKLAASCLSWTLKQPQLVSQNSRQLFLIYSKFFFKLWEEKWVIPVVPICSTMSPIMPTAVWSAGSFLHWAEDTCHPSSSLHKLSVPRRWYILLLAASGRNRLLRCVGQQTVQPSWRSQNIDTNSMATEVRSLWLKKGW